MATNDIVLLDSLVGKAAARFSNPQDESELFELFAFEQVLKTYEPSFDELEGGWTDGGNDGGIDGFFIYVDQRPGTPDAADYALKRRPVIDVFVITCRRSATFEQQPIDSLISSLSELLDLRHEDGALSYPFNDAVLQQRKLFRDIFIGLADRDPSLILNVLYCSRGDTTKVAPNIVARANVLAGALKELFSEAKIETSFMGAAEL
jgi:hypothetical protein